MSCIFEANLADTRNDVRSKEKSIVPEQEQACSRSTVLSRIIFFFCAGIQFGPDGLKLLQPGMERIAKCRLGSYYARMPDGSRSLFGPSDDPKGTQLRELKCYVAVGEGESWELDGIVWKTKK